MPNVGYSERRGEYLGLAYFQTLGRSYDTTFFYDWYGKGYYGGGNEFRYRPTEGTRGLTSVYMINDVETGDWRWKAAWDHESNDLPWGLRGVITFRDFSDFDFFRDFERGYNLSTVRRIPSRAFLSGSWGAQSLNVQVERVQTFLSTDTRDQPDAPARGRLQPEQAEARRDAALPLVQRQRRLPLLRRRGRGDDELRPRRPGCRS